LLSRTDIGNKQAWLTLLGERRVAIDVIDCIEILCPANLPWMLSGMRPPTKTRFEMLLGSKEHEMHHRAQLMLIERMLGIIPHLARQMQERMAVASGVAVR
jgi:hypothetical protein